MPAFNFKGRFEPAIQSGKKRQTIRADRKDGRVARPGQTAYLFVGLRTAHCRPLGKAPITHVDPIEIQAAKGTAQLKVTVAGRKLSEQEIETLARADGFESRWEMRAFFGRRLPLSGYMVTWDPTRMEAAQ